MDQSMMHDKGNFLNEVIRYYIKRIKIFAVIGLVVALMIVGYKVITSYSIMSTKTVTTMEQTKGYVGVSKIFIGNDSTVSSANAVRLYLTSKDLLMGAMDELNLTIPYDDLRNMINLQSSIETMIVLNILGDDEELVQNVTEYITTKGSVGIRKDLHNYDVKVVEKANTTEREYSKETTTEVSGPLVLLKNCIKYGIIGFMLGLFIACAVLLAAFLLDDTIKSERDVWVLLGLPVLGSVSVINGSKKSIKRKWKTRKLRLSQYTSDMN